MPDSDSVSVSLQPPCPARLANLCGAMDGNIAHLAGAFDVRIWRRGSDFRLRGAAAKPAAAALQKLYARADRDLSAADVQMCAADSDIPPAAATAPARGGFAAQTESQRQFLQKIREHALTFCTGPAGAGKTHVSLAAALELLEEGAHDRIVLTRPAMEAGGEKIGFLPGDMEQKVDPYLRPLRDILHALLGKRQAEKRLADGRVEVIPLSFMRGLTIDNAAMIVDEAQNTTPGQMKMILTRLGGNGRIVINGDDSQSDLPRGAMSGLDDALARLSDVEGVACHCFSEDDIVRHPLVARIVRAYQRPPNRGGDSDSNSNSNVKSETDADS